MIKKNIFLVHGPEDFLIELERNRLVFELKKNGYEEREIFFSKNSFSYEELMTCLLYTSPSPRDDISSRMPSSA